MKLKTKGSPAKGRAHHGSTDDFIHDAAAAHALMEAINLRCGHNTDWQVMECADELMREWGFES